jgi:hypothetical protein|tara:strand:- start:1295 stop:1570 length:276 start_codon:yes stop_codon:yes gene_type:complete
MTKEKFLNIEIEEPPVELQLSVEMRVREILKSDDVVGIKKYCTHLIRHQMKQDVFLASLLGRVIELEAALDKKYRADELNTMDKIKKFFHN